MTCSRLTLERPRENLNRLPAIKLVNEVFAMERAYPYVAFFQRTLVARGGLSPSHRAQLLIHLHKIKVVPRFYKHAVFDAGDDDAVEIGSSSSSFESQTVAF